MARITVGPLLSSIAGSVGAITFRNDASGLVLQPRILPTRRASEGQLQHRGFLAQSAAAWGALDADMRRAWTTLARQERIPDVFAQGRRWTGRQLFTCFYLYTEHQYTPMPARWLPRSPIFHASAGVSALFWNAFQLFPGDWRTQNYFAVAYPTSINPGSPGGWSSNCCGCIWFGYRRAQSSPPPRRWFKLAPLPASWGLWGLPGGKYHSGDTYYGWDPYVLRIMGYPPGLPDGTTAPIPAPFWISVKSTVVTDDRLYYSPIVSGQNWVSNVPIAGTNYGCNLTTPKDSPTVLRSYPLNIPTTEY